MLANDDIVDEYPRRKCPSLTSGYISHSVNERTRGSSTSNSIRNLYYFVSSVSCSQPKREPTIPYRVNRHSSAAGYGAGLLQPSSGECLFCRVGVPAYGERPIPSLYRNSLSCTSLSCVVSIAAVVIAQASWTNESHEAIGIHGNLSRRRHFDVLVSKY